MCTAIGVGLFLIGAALLVLLFEHLNEVEKTLDPNSAQEQENKEPPTPVNRIKRYWKN